MRIYLADLAHDYMPARQFAPLGIGYIGAFLKKAFGDAVDVRLFKSAERLLDAVESQRPDMVGFTNYIWNAALTAWAGRTIRAALPDMPIIMGGPNIRTDEAGIGAFLARHEYVDRYCLYSGEATAADIVRFLIALPPEQRTAAALRRAAIDGSYALADGKLAGNAQYRIEDDLDYIPSPYLSGLMDEFLDEGFIPIIETNRGCPFSCTFCVWGIAALNKLKRFGMERIVGDLEYVARSGRRFPQIVFADANFGILKRDVDIARTVRDLYEETGAFSAVEIYWSKSAQDHMVDIGRILGKLTHTYIAFQSLDDDVLSAIERRNISTEKLVGLIDRLRGYTHSTRTDILVGLPGETFESHLRTLDKTLAYGINFILGGEIRLLPGSEMESDAHRERFGIRAKYRFYEGGAGVYRGELVYELEEVIRQTVTMSEEEMISLRVLRALFFASVTLTEHRPIIAVLAQKGVRITELFRRLVELGRDDPAFSGVLEWLFRQAREEWFISPAEAAEFVRDETNRADLFNERAFAKLNFGILARLLLNDDEYEAYYRLIGRILGELLPDVPPATVAELLILCRERNYIRKLIRGDARAEARIEMSPATLGLLREGGYLRPDHSAFRDGVLDVALDDVTRRGIAEAFEPHRGRVSNFALSQIMQSFIGRLHMDPRQDDAEKTIRAGAAA